jgi:hypothetical protein
MKFYYSNRTGPFVFLALILGLIVIVPLLSGFLLLAMASALVGWIALTLRRGLGFRRPATPNEALDAKIVVMDRDDKVISIQD